MVLSNHFLLLQAEENAKFPPPPTLEWADNQITKKSVLNQSLKLREIAAFFSFPRSTARRVLRPGRRFPCAWGGWRNVGGLVRQESEELRWFGCISVIPQCRAPRSRSISFAGFRLEADGTLLRGETPVHLPPKELAALRLLLANAGRIVTPLQLRQALWGDVHVTADSVPKCVSSLRARLEPEECIQTVYKRGYRFTAGVRAQALAPVEHCPGWRFCPSPAATASPIISVAVVAEETMARLSGSSPRRSLRPGPGFRLHPGAPRTHRPRNRRGAQSGHGSRRHPPRLAHALPAPR